MILIRDVAGGYEHSEKVTYQATCQRFMILGLFLSMNAGRPQMDSVGLFSARWTQAVQNDIITSGIGEGVLLQGKFVR